MKALKIALCAAAATLAFGSAASAADVSFNAALTNDYVFRGLSQNPDSHGVANATASVGADVTSGILYAGVWASDVSFANAEIDGYFGVKPTVGAVSLDLGAIYYGYVDAFYDDASYWELKAAASVPAGPATLGGAIFYSPELSGNMGDAIYYEANVSAPFRKGTLSAAYGVQTLDDGLWAVDSYTTWNAGVTLPVNDTFSVDIRYVGTDDDANFVGFAKDEFVATLKATF